MSFDSFDHDFERGMGNRRSVLGDVWVDRSVANATNFTADFQNLITRFAWHEIWSRPGLDHKTRRIIVLAITIALGRWEEFELHVRAGLLGDEATRLSPDEMKEVLMQSAIYAGVPAANTAFSHAQKILREVSEQIGYAVDAQSPAEVAHPGVGKQGRTSTSPSLHYSVREPRNGATANGTIVLSHALGTDLTMWDGLANQLATDYRVITYDHRGHGSSDATEGAYTMGDLADDAARLLLALNSGPVIWVGLSMGGMVGQELALRYPHLVRGLVLANTTSVYPSAARETWQQRIVTVRDSGLESIADAVMTRYFHDAFRHEHPAMVAHYRQRLTSTDKTGYIGCCHAVATVDTHSRLHQIAVPTLVIAGDKDAGTPVDMSQALVDAIAQARLEIISDASHLSAIEQPAAFSAAVSAFIAKVCE